MYSIKTKVLSITAAGMLLMLAAIYAVVDHFYIKNVRSVAASHIREAQELFNEHMDFDAEKMVAVLNMFTREEEFKKLLVQRDRDRLFEKGEPVFRMLKENYGITHFYFHLPDGTNFLRLHSRMLHGDKVDREPFRTAVVTGRTAIGIELGRTAFALRAVTPYYYGSKLIGYLELGEEIDHFIDFLKKTKGEEFGIIAEKSQLGMEEFLFANAQKGVPSNWNLMQKHVWINRPNQKIVTSGYSTEESIELFEREAAIVPPKTSSGTLIFGGFPLNDVQGRHVGVVVGLMDMAPQMKVLSEMKTVSMVVLSILFVGIFTLMGMLLQRWVIEPVRKVAEATRRYARGELDDHRVAHRSGDEIGELAETTNEMATQLAGMYRDAREHSRKLEELNETLKSLAITDGLTGLVNHRHFSARLSEEINRAIRYKHPLSLLMIDVDHFKQYNDTFGHTRGDTLLKSIAITIGEHARNTDIIARYGGDEFAAILPETDVITALGIAERIRRFVAADSGGQATCSIGVAALSGEGETDKDLIDRADKGLYGAKAAGRNRVMTG